MKKTGKAGLGHLKKMEKISREMTIGRAVLAAAADTKKVARQSRRHCG
jgi:hypothetical protein